MRSAISIIEPVLIGYVEHEACMCTDRVNNGCVDAEAVAVEKVVASKKVAA